MLKIIPSVKEMKIGDEHLTKHAIYYTDLNCDSRVLDALSTLPFDTSGAKLDISITGGSGEGYELDIRENTISIRAESAAGAFYGVQTLRQIFMHEEIPCLSIKDAPDFAYRGFYHDVTRGKIPTVATIKELVDHMAFYKLNSLQLYVEHTYAFEEYQALNEKFGCLTADELKEIDAYCTRNFIDFIPSLSTFGHLFELLNQEQYKHLRVLKEYESRNVWSSRMRHHTIDPLHPGSFPVIRSLIDQYVPNFTSEYFNICCDETFDLKEHENQGKDAGQIYVDFVKKITDYTKQKGKTVMMWADILLKYPETIEFLPEDICFLNWNYSDAPKEENIIKFANMHRKQIVCPGTSTWNRLCENVDKEEKNISLMAQYGYQHGALGVLNTNWGDWGNPCSLELGMYGLVLGAEKSWSAMTEIDNPFYDSVNFLLYQNENGIQYLKELSRLHDLVSWKILFFNYFIHRYPTNKEPEDCLFASLPEIQKAYKALSEKLQAEQWSNDEYRQEMLIAAEGICMLAELSAKLSGTNCPRITDTAAWLEKYQAKWLQKNKPSELFRIVDLLTDLEAM